MRAKTKVTQIHPVPQYANPASFIPTHAAEDAYWYYNRLEGAMELFAIHPPSEKCDQETLLGAFAEVLGKVNARLSEALRQRVVPEPGEKIIDVGG